VPTRPADPDSLLGEWFGGDIDSPEGLRARARAWFSRDPPFDALLHEHFGTWPDRARQGEFASWLDAPRPALALVLCLDQLPRNLFRETAQAFAYDAAAREAALAAIARGFDALLRPAEATFLYMPLEHAEDLALQDRSVSLFRALRDRVPEPMRPQFESFFSYAERHRAVIERFSRFPHRNDLLGRPSTIEEQHYLKTGGDRF
jgi:uncharacterized protein (DUF924 family)